MLQRNQRQRISHCNEDLKEKNCVFLLKSLFFFFSWMPMSRITHLQWWKVQAAVGDAQGDPTASGQPVPALRHQLGTEGLPAVRGNCPCSGLCPPPPVTAPGTTEEPFSALSLQVLTDAGKVPSFSRKNSTSTQPFLTEGLQSLATPAALCQTPSRTPTSLRHRGDHNRTQHSRCGLTSAEQRERIATFAPPRPPPTTADPQGQPLPVLPVLTAGGAATTSRKLDAAKTPLPQGAARMGARNGRAAKSAAHARCPPPPEGPFSVRRHFREGGAAAAGAVGLRSGELLGEYLRWGDGGRLRSGESQGSGGTWGRPLRLFGAAAWGAWGYGWI